MLIRRLTALGIAEFERFLQRLGTANANADCSALLTHPEFSESLSIGDVEIESRQFDSRREFAEYIDGRFRAAGINNDVDIQGMWEWLSVCYLDQLLPRGRSTGKDPRRFIIDATVGRRSHRHLLRNPYMLYRQFRNSDGRELDLLLCDELWNHGDIVENLTARARLANSPGVLRTARKLYFDPLTGKPKTGTRHGVAGHRNFSRFLLNLPTQFDLTEISEDTILALLPSSFEVWLNKSHEIESSTGDAESTEKDVVEKFSEFEGGIPDTLELADILQNVASRKMSTSHRRVRRDYFRAAVLGAYENQCAISRTGLVYSERNQDISYEVQAAHVIPVARGGRDLIQNGLALNRSLHWAFDLGMVWIDSDMRVNVSRDVQTDRRNEWLRGFEGHSLSLPDDPRLSPSYEALSWHAEHVAIR